MWDSLVVNLSCIIAAIIWALFTQQDILTQRGKFLIHRNVFLFFFFTLDSCLFPSNLPVSIALFSKSFRKTMVTIYVASEISGARAIFNSSLSQHQHKLIVIFFAAGGSLSICITMEGVTLKLSFWKKNLHLVANRPPLPIEALLSWYYHVLMIRIQTLINIEPKRK